MILIKTQTTTHLTVPLKKPKRMQSEYSIKRKHFTWPISEKRAIEMGDIHPSVRPLVKHGFFVLHIYLAFDFFIIIASICTYLNMLKTNKGVRVLLSSTPRILRAVTSPQPASCNALAHVWYLIVKVKHEQF